MIQISFHSKLLLSSMGVSVARPFYPANVAELVAASAFHSSASLTPLDNHLALHALPVAQVFFEKLNFIFITLSLVDGKHALPAKAALTGFALHNGLFARHGDYPIVAFFTWTESQVWVFESTIKSHNFSRFGFYLVRQSCKKVPF